MRLISSSLRPCALGLLCVMALGACSEGSAGASAAGGASASTSTSTPTYHLVTQLRPESPERFFGPARAAYDLCVESAKAKGLPVKPFPALGKDVVAARTVHAWDGKRRFFKETEWKIDTSANFGAETGCAMKLASYWHSSVTTGTTSRSAGRSSDGEFALNDETPADDQVVDPARLARYTESKLMHGVQLKCTTEGDCIVDPALALVNLGNRPALAAARIEDARTPLLLEPVSLTVGKAVDPSLFKQENAE